MPEPPAASVVIPAYNEQDNVAAVYRAVRDALPGVDAEIIFVDDGSRDATAARVRELRAADPRVRLIRLTRNFGQQCALVAGLEAARGPAVITLDCDLQHPPDYLPLMMDAWSRGAMVVQMVRRDTERASWFKRATSRMFYRLINLLSESPVVPGAADYQLLDRRVAEAVLRFRDREPFVRGIVAWLGYPSYRIEYVAPPRHSGVSVYTLRKMLRLSLRAVTSLSAKPLRMSFYLGFASILICIAYALFAVAAYFAGRSFPGWTSLVLLIVFMGSVQLVSVGILGEYLARVYENSRRVPTFVAMEDSEVHAAAPEPLNSRWSRE